MSGVVKYYVRFVKGGIGVVECLEEGVCVCDIDCVCFNIYLVVDSV